MKFLFGLFSLCVIQSSVSAQTHQEIKTIEDLVIEIDENLDDLAKKIESSDSISFRHSFMDGKELVLISVGYLDGVSNLDKKVNWYFYRGDFIFSETTWTDNSNTEIEYSNKCYFWKRNLVSFIERGERTSRLNSAELSELEKKTLEYTDKIKSSYQK